MMDSAMVDLSEIRPHPDNHRLGNHEKIRQSLKKNGQYRPLIVQRSTGYIIKGNNTYKVMRKMGWKQAHVAYVDVDARKALEIVVGDNVASDKSHTDQGAALAILASLPSLSGTTYDQFDLRLPDLPPLDPMPPNLEPDGEEAEHVPDPAPEKLPVLAVGRAKAGIQQEEFTRWRATMPRRKSEAVERLSELLGIELEPPGVPENILASMAQAPINSLIPYPGNPQQGDTGLVYGLLKAHGQYSPVIVNSRTMHILAGHTLTRAAKAMGWEEVGVNWLDIPEEDEPYILLADNHTAELATNDNERLGAIIAKLGTLRNTGLELEDAESIMAGHSLKPAGAGTEKIKIHVGNVPLTVTWDQLDAMGLEEGRELLDVAERVGIDPNQVRL